MNIFPGRGPSGARKTPPPLMFPPSRDVWDRQEALRDSYIPFTSGSGSAHNMYRGNGPIGQYVSSCSCNSSPSERLLHPCDCSGTSYSHTILSNIDHILTLHDSRDPKNLFGTAGDPGQQVGFSCQEIQQAAGGPQDGGVYPNPDIGGSVHSTLPPNQHTYRETVADYSNPGSYVCPDCGVMCKRAVDLDRHQRTARNHRDPTGPTCPEPGCKYSGKFTRLDNFRIHFRRQHGKSDEEVDDFIREWRAARLLVLEGVS